MDLTTSSRRHHKHTNMIVGYAETDRQDITYGQRRRHATIVPRSCHDRSPIATQLPPRPSQRKTTMERTALASGFSSNTLSTNNFISARGSRHGQQMIKEELGTKAPGAGKSIRRKPARASRVIGPAVVKRRSGTSSVLHLLAVVVFRRSFTSSTSSMASHASTEISNPSPYSDQRGVSTGPFSCFGTRKSYDP